MSVYDLREHLKKLESMFRWSIFWAELSTRILYETVLRSCSITLKAMIQVSA